MSAAGVFQTYRIAEDAHGRLVLQRNWLNHLVGAVFLLPFGGLLLWFAWYDRDDRVSLGLGLLFGLPIFLLGLYVFLSGLGNRNARICFDARSRSVHFDRPTAGGRRDIAFADLLGVGIRSETRESGTPGSDRYQVSTIYTVQLRTRHGEDAEINRTGVRDMADHLAARVADVCGLSRP